MGMRVARLINHRLNCFAAALSELTAPTNSPTAFLAPSKRSSMKRNSVCCDRCIHPADRSVGSWLSDTPTAHLLSAVRVCDGSINQGRAVSRPVRDGG